MCISLCRASPPLGQPQLMALFQSLPELPNMGHLPVTLMETVRLYTPWAVASANETPEEGLPLLDVFTHLLDTGERPLTCMQVVAIGSASHRTLPVTAWPHCQSRVYLVSAMRVRLTLSLRSCIGMPYISSWSCHMQHSSVCLAWVQIAMSEP